MLKNDISINKLFPQSVLKHSVDHFQGIGMKLAQGRHNGETQRELAGIRLEGMVVRHHLAAVCISLLTEVPQEIA